MSREIRIGLVFTMIKHQGISSVRMDQRERDWLEARRVTVRERSDQLRDRAGRFQLVFESFEIRTFERERERVHGQVGFTCDRVRKRVKRFEIRILDF